MSDSKSGLSDEELQSILEGGDEGAAKDAEDSESSSAEGTITFEGLAARATSTSTGSLFSAWESELGSGDQAGTDDLSKSESSGLRDILAVAQTIRQPAGDREGDGDTEELLRAGDGASVGLIIAADDDHLDATSERFGGTASAALVDHGDSGLIELADAGGGELVAEARAAAKVKAQAAKDAEVAREERQGRKRRPWIAAIVVLVALGGGVGLVLAQGDEGSGTPSVARAEQSSMTAAPHKEVESTNAREAERSDSVEEPVAEPAETGADDPGTDEATLLAAAGTDADADGTDVPERGSGVVDSMRGGKDKASGKSKSKDADKAGDDGDAAADEEPRPPAGEPKPEEAGGDPPAEAAEGDDVPEQGGDQAGEAAAEEPAAEEPAEKNKVDCLLNPDQEKCGGKKKQADTEAKQDDGPKLPEKLNATQLRNGFASIKAAAKKCGQQHGAEAGIKVKIHVSIEGATGTVKSAKAKGDHAGTPLGDCVAKTALEANFAQFTKDVMGTDFSLRM